MNYTSLHRELPPLLLEVLFLGQEGVCVLGGFIDLFLNVVPCNTN